MAAALTIAVAPAHAQPSPAPQPPPLQPAPAPQQPSPPPSPPAPAPQQPPAPPQPAQQPQQPPAAWYRFMLADGRVVDGQWVGGDAHSYYVQTAGGLFSIPRANVTGAVPLMAPAPMAPPPMAPAPVVMAAPPPPVSYEPPDEGRGFRRKAQGWGTFVLAYGTTALIALGRRDEDPDALLGLIPIAGPILWTTTDEDEWGKDGYDWLAILSSLSQIGGVVGILKGYADDPAPRRANVTVAPVAGRSFGGVVLGGAF